MTERFHETFTPVDFEGLEKSQAISRLFEQAVATYPHILKVLTPGGDLDAIDSAYAKQLPNIIESRSTRRQKLDFINMIVQLELSIGENNFFNCAQSISEKYNITLPEPDKALNQ